MSRSAIALLLCLAASSACAKNDQTPWIIDTPGLTPPDLINIDTIMRSLPPDSRRELRGKHLTVRTMYPPRGACYEITVVGGTEIDVFARCVRKYSGEIVDFGPPTIPPDSGATPKRP